MISKDIKFNKDAKNKLLKGINLVGDAVGCTLGPKGNCVVIGDIDKKPIVTKDGVTVAKYVETKDLTEDAGVKLIREAATKMLNEVGDATTTATVIAQAMINESTKYFNKVHPIQLKQDLQKLSKDVLDHLKDFIINISDGDILNIATISANNDYEIGKLIYDAFQKIGKDGIINIEESQNSNTSIKIIEGMQFDKGYVAQHFVTDTNKDQCVLDNPYIFITEHKLERMKDLALILNKVVNESRSILIIASDYDEEVIETFKVNVLQNRIKCCLVKAPSFGEYRKSILDDIAILTKGFNISYDYPFVAGPFDATWINDLSINYNSDHTWPEWDWKTGLKFVLPFHYISFVFEGYHNFINEYDYEKYNDAMYSKEERTGKSISECCRGSGC